MYVTANRRKHNLAWVIKIYNNDNNNNNNNIFFLIASLQITREQLSRKQKHQQQSDVHHFLPSQQRICVNTQNLIPVLYVKIGNDYFIQ